MIALTRLNGQRMMVNCDLIESVEETPDTLVTLTSGNKIPVRETMQDVRDRVVAFKRSIYAPSA